MPFIVQRQSDRKYHGGEHGWVESEHDAEAFGTHGAAQLFCAGQTGEKCDIYMRLRTGVVVRAIER